MSNENKNDNSTKENKEKELLIINNTNNVLIPKNIKKNFVLPNLKNRYVSVSANENNKKIAYDSMKKYDNDLKNKSVKSVKRILNKSTSFPNLRENELNRLKEKYGGKIVDYSNRTSGKNQISKVNDINANYKSMRNPTNIKKIKINFFADKIKQFKKLFTKGENEKESRNFNEKSLILNLTKNTNTNDETTKEDKKINNNLSNSKSTIFKMSKINLNKYPMSNINKNQDNNKQTYNSSLLRIPKYSKFFHQSQKDAIGAHTIYNYYLKKSSSELTLPVQNYGKLFSDRNQTVFEKLKRIYCENKNFDALIKELKDNKKIAFKDDFDIEEYQNTLLELLEKRVSQKNLLDLQDDYRELNKKLFNFFEPKGRYTFLAEKLRYNLPSFLLEKMKQLDRDSIISRMNYYNQFKQFKKDKKLIIKFGRKDDINKKIKIKKKNEQSDEDNNDIE